MKVRALKTFEGIKDLERDVYPKAGDVWEVSEKRANFLKSHGVVEFVEEEKVPAMKPEVQKKIVEMGYEAIKEAVKSENKSSKKKKHSKK